MMQDEFIERRIVIGCCVSDNFMVFFEKNYQKRYLTSQTARTIAGWCLTYFQKYNKVPKKDIEGIYMANIDSLSEEQALDIEDILVNLSDEFERDKFNTQYLIDQTSKFFKERHLTNFADDIKGALVADEIIEAEKIALMYNTPIKDIDKIGIDPFDDEEAILRAFGDESLPIVSFPKYIGKYWNNQFKRDNFLVLQAPEKSGKTFLLMEIAFKALLSGCNVAFFQAGDMTENQMLRRMGVYLAKKSDLEEYCTDNWKPVIDCEKNQLDTCSMKERECDHGIWSSSEEKITYDDLLEIAKDNKDYSPCSNCEKIAPCTYLEKLPDTMKLTGPEAVTKFRTWKKHNKKRFKLATFSNSTLHCREINNCLDLWEAEDGFVADVIIVDYIDILTHDPEDSKHDARHQGNSIWKKLRTLSQERHVLLASATQAAASCYGKDIMDLEDFSEDKRKYAHVTAMYGLNQTKEEKKLGILRLNELVKREGSFDSLNQCSLLQKLEIGRPLLGSFRTPKPKKQS